MKTDTFRKNHPDPKRAQLEVLLEVLNISIESFDKLRADSYEKHLAKRSLDLLETLYTTLLNPGETYEKIRETCPRWDKGSRFDGQLPSVTTLTEIKQRIISEQTANNLGRNARYLQSLRNRLTGLPMQERVEVFDMVLTLINEEMVGAKFDGNPILGNLPALDRMLRALMIGLREQHSAERIKLRKGLQKIQERKLALQAGKSRGEAANPKAESGKRPMIGNKAETGMPPGAKAAKEDEYAGLTEDEKSERLLERAFGKNPYKNKPQRHGDTEANGTLDPTKN